MLKNELLIETIGEPDMFVLDAVEQGILFESLFENVCKLTTHK